MPLPSQSALIMVSSVTEIVSPIPTTKPLVNGTKLTISPCCSTEVDKTSSTAEAMTKVKNPSLQVTADHKIKMLEAPILRPGPGDVLLHIKVTGICGYDFSCIPPIHRAKLTL